MPIYLYRTSIWITITNLAGPIVFNKIEEMLYSYMLMWNILI